MSSELLIEKTKTSKHGLQVSFYLLDSCYHNSFNASVSKCSFIARNQVKIQPVVTRKGSANNLRNKNSSSSRQLKSKQITTMASKTFDKNEIRRNLRSSGRGGLKSPQRGKKKTKNGEYFKMASGIMKKSVTKPLARKCSNLNANFTPSQSVSIMSGSQKDEARKLSDVSNISSTIRLVSDTETSGSASNSIDNRPSTYKREISLHQKYGSRKIRKKVDIDQNLFSKSLSKQDFRKVLTYKNFEFNGFIEIQGLKEKTKVDLPLEKKKTGIEADHDSNVQLVTEPSELKENNFEGVFTPKEDDTFSNRVTTLDICNENVGDSNQVFMIEVKFDIKVSQIY